MVVEYALKGINQPMGAAGYELTKHLPPELADKLPQPEELEGQIMIEIGKDEGGWVLLKWTHLLLSRSYGAMKLFLSWGSVIFTKG